MVVDRARILFKVVEDDHNEDLEIYKWLFKLPKHEFEAEVEKNKNLGEFDRMHYYMNTDPAKMCHLKTIGLGIKLFKQKFENVVHEIINIRNKIIKVQNEWREYDKPENAGLDTRHVAKFISF